MEQNNEQKNGKRVVELSYEAAKPSKVLAAGFFDIFVMIVTALLLLFFTFTIIQNNGSYNKALDQRVEVLYESHLYQDKEGHPYRLDQLLRDDNDLSYNEKTSKLDAEIEYFFTRFIDDNEKTDPSMRGKGAEIFKEYKRKAEDSNGTKLFDDSFNRTLTNADYDALYFNFYCDLMDSAIGYLQVNSDYVKTRNFINNVNLWGIIATISFSYIIYYLILPLCFRRGKRTIGMMLMRISMVGADGMSCSWKRYLFHFFFSFIFLFFGSIFAFLIPLAISITMVFLRADHRRVNDYVVGTYLVNSDQALIYLDAAEYRGFERKAEKEQVDSYNIDEMSSK